jgi:hypothetical protein
VAVTYYDIHRVGIMKLVKNRRSIRQIKVSGWVTQCFIQFVGALWLQSPKSSGSFFLFHFYFVELYPEEQMIHMQ